MLYIMYIVYLWKQNNIIMESLKRTVVNIFIVLCMLLCFACDDDTNEDWSEIVNLYVSNELADYTPWGASEGAQPLEGIKVKENENDDWFVIPIGAIEGFSYEEGYFYLLKTEKIYFANPVSDGMSVKYKLIDILSKE